jgi:hypothetical protein
MKLYCKSCGLFVADIKQGSHTRKGSVMICKTCLERFEIADKMANMARKSSKDLFGGENMPDTLKNIFDTFAK